MLKRPCIHDDDDEVLRQQAEFFQQKAQHKIIPSAKLATSHEGNNASSSAIEKMDVPSQIGNVEENIQDQVANTFEAIPTDINLNQITEKKSYSAGIPKLKFDSAGFPKAVRRTLDIKPREGSIFSQDIKRLKMNVDHTQNEDLPSLIVKEQIRDETLSHSTRGNIMNLQTLGSAAEKSTVLTISDKKKIHLDNLKTLNAMSEGEIVSERNKLLNTLDPALIQFLKSQRSKNTSELETRNRTIKEQNQVAQMVNIEQLEAPKEILSKPEASGWLHFNEFEASKLAWMKDVSVPKLKNCEGFEARFDFEGYLLPYSVAQFDELNRHLYHHGDEPERPGYSLQELLLLSRSNVSQQRIIALNTLANVLSVDQTGIYDQVIDIPIEQVFFVLRVSIDDNVPSVLNAAVKALRNFFYYQIDETCLDNMASFGLGLVQPVLAVDHTEDDSTINDQQLAEINLVKCLARTEIFSRIRYIINTVKPPFETVIYCIELLIRLARDSEFIVNKIFHCEGLLSGILKYFLPPVNKIKTVSSYNTPLPQVVKLIRVLSSKKRIIADHLLREHNLLHVIVSYLHEDLFSQNAFGMKLQVECMRYWTLLIHYGLTLEFVEQNRNILLKFLDYHFKNTDNNTSATLIRQSHLGALLILLAKTVEKGFNLFPDLMKECFVKWINQYKNVQEYTCGQLQITSALLYYSAICNKNTTPIYSSEYFEIIFESCGFNTSTQYIINGSLLLNNYETHKTTANLKTLEAAAWFSIDHIVPVMQWNSCIPFLYTLSTCVLYDSSSKVKIKFLNHPHINAYTVKLKSFRSYFNISNWFTRCESFLIMNILKIAQSVQDSIEPALYYDIAVKALCVFSSEQKSDLKYLIDNVVFCSRFYALEIAMSNTRLNETTDELNQAWQHLGDIRKVYTDVLGLTKEVLFQTNTCLDVNAVNVIPADWIYTPLVILYSNQKKHLNRTTNDECKNLFIILNCLRWILLYETYFPVLADSISPTEKYVRLGCLFLCSDNLFLDRELLPLLERIYKFLVKAENRINFEQEIVGLTNFKDFFVQLLEQYQAVSYGNKLFGNVLLFPLLKRHDIKLRKILWSEYMGVVESFMVKRNEVWLNPEDLIYPVETDPSLYSCYRKALGMKTVPVDSIMHNIAEINVREFKETAENLRCK
ncbi:RNA polymerase II-associated protein 1 [Euwallacea fornicatus]|uniref:RNA polymerase II-associated protein 1 n=1 Tax=Euwallacea fornicatus TaxID=995702 RepID=UPI00338DC33B